MSAEFRLSDEQREALRRAGVRLIVHNNNDDLLTTLESIVASEVEAAERALVERWTDWLANIGWGIDYRSDELPPCSLDDLADAYVRTTGDEDHETWAATIQAETGTFARPNAEGDA